MSHTDVDFQARLLVAAERLKLDLSADAVEKLLVYIQQLQRWNKTYNLTAVRDPEQMLIQHVFDSMAVVPLFKEVLHTSVPNSARIVDVGAGAGLPGVVLAICLPDVQVTCVDAVEKKMAFVRQMTAVLSLPNLSAEHRRIEQGESYQADVVTSRAFASLVDFVSLAKFHVKPNGYMLAMKGKHPSDEIAALVASELADVEQVKTVEVPELDAERCVVYLKPKG